MAKEKMKSTLTSYEDVDKQLYELAKLEAFLSEQEADMNRELQEIEKKYLKATRTSIEKKNSIMVNIDLFAQEHKKDFTDKKRTMKLTYGSISFRKGTGAVVLLKKVKDGMKLAAISLQNMFGSRFIRLVPEVNKESLQEAYNNGSIDEIELAAVNLRIEKSEKANVKINWKALEKEGLKLVDVKKAV